MISIVIPVFNEEKIIGEEIDNIKKIMDDSNMAYEIVAVDDGSSDKTLEIISEKDVKLIKHQVNRGYGASLKSGIKESQYNIIVITDSDGSYPNEEIPALVKYISENDMVIGARTGKSVKVPALRRPAKWLIGKLANYLTGVNIPDINSGMRVMKKELVEKFNNILPDGFSFTTTITLAMLTSGYPIKYVPINYKRRIGRSKIRPIRDTLNFIQIITRTIMYFEPLKIFIPLSLLFFVVAIFIFLYSYFFLQNVMDITTVILFVTGIQLIAIGMIADLIDKRLLK